MKGGVYRWRRLYQAGFFSLFVLVPVFDLFRLDLTLGHFILFGQPWTLGLEGFADGSMPRSQAAINIFVRVFLPIVGGAIVFLWIAWRYGRLYCGWLCPHFSVVESINGLMRRASGKPSVWERKPLSEYRSDGRKIPPRRGWWLPAVVAIVFFSFLWALTLLTYLLPPKEIYTNLVSGELTRNQGVFLASATFAFIIEFSFARHLFCRFGCAVGLFQSLAWMANPGSMEVNFNQRKAGLCRDCNNACDNSCPMRLKPRGIKRARFTCTQCTECISACANVQGGIQKSLLVWSADQAKPDSRFMVPLWKSR